MNNYGILLTITKTGRDNPRKANSAVLSMPTTRQKVRESFKKLGVTKNDYKIISYEIRAISSSLSTVAPTIPDTMNLDMLNYYSELIKNIHPNERDKFEAALFHTGKIEIRDVASLTQNLDCFEFVEVDNHHDLGRYLYENFEAKYPIAALKPFLDLEAMGKAYEARRNGEFVANGFICRNDKPFVIEFDTRKIPDNIKVLPPQNRETEHER